MGKKITQANMLTREGTIEIMTVLDDRKFHDRQKLIQAYPGSTRNAENRINQLLSFGFIESRPNPKSDREIQYKINELRWDLIKRYLYDYEISMRLNDIRWQPNIGTHGLHPDEIHEEFGDEFKKLYNVLRKSTARIESLWIKNSLYKFDKTLELILTQISTSNLNNRKIVISYFIYHLTSWANVHRITKNRIYKQYLNKILAIDDYKASKIMKIKWDNSIDETLRLFIHKYIDSSYTDDIIKLHDISFLPSGLTSYSLLDDIVKLHDIERTSWVHSFENALNQRPYDLHTIDKIKQEVIERFKMQDYIENLIVPFQKKNPNLFHGDFGLLLPNFKPLFILDTMA